MTLCVCTVAAIELYDPRVIGNVAAFGSGATITELNLQLQHLVWIELQGFFRMIRNIANHDRSPFSDVLLETWVCVTAVLSCVNDCIAQSHGSGLWPTVMLQAVSGYP